MNLLPAPRILGNSISSSMADWYGYKTGTRMSFCPTNDGVVDASKCVPRLIEGGIDFVMLGKGYDTLVFPIRVDVTAAFRAFQQALNDAIDRGNIPYAPHLSVAGILGPDTFLAMRYVFYRPDNIFPRIGGEDIGLDAPTAWLFEGDGPGEKADPAAIQEAILRKTAMLAYGMTQRVLALSEFPYTSSHSDPLPDLRGASGGPLGLYDHEKGFVYVGVGIAVAVAAVVGGVMLYRRSKR